MLLFDIGANRGDAVVAGLNKGYKVVALEAAPKIYRALEANFASNPNVKTLKFAVAEKDFQNVQFYECIEDGLSTLNKDWLTAEGMPYKGKHFWTVEATTITVDTLVKLYGTPDLIKIDVEGAEWAVFNGMTQKCGTLTFEWTFETLKEHEKQLDYLYKLGYREVAPQYIVHHLDEPTEWYKLKEDNTNQLYIWHQTTSDAWINGGWKESSLRPTADVGMLWLR